MYTLAKPTAVRPLTATRYASSLLRAVTSVSPRRASPREAFHDEDDDQRRERDDQDRGEDMLADRGVRLVLLFRLRLGRECAADLLDRDDRRVSVDGLAARLRMQCVLLL